IPAPVILPAATPAGTAQRSLSPDPEVEASASDSSIIRASRPKRAVSFMRHARLGRHILCRASMAGHKTERLPQGNVMRSDERTSTDPQPQTRNEMQVWIREQLKLPAAIERSLLAAMDAVFTRHERLWQESKQEAIRALSAGFADKMARAKNELSVKDATVSSISQYFEKLVEDLTDKTQRDPKTKLMNFSRFTEQLESFLALEQRGTWCAVGLVDITGFKWYNDALGHAIGDRIIERVAQLLREQARSDDIIAQERNGSRDLHARFGGDEFCFLIPDLDEYHQAY